MRVRSPVRSTRSLGGRCRRALSVRWCGATLSRMDERARALDAAHRAATAFLATLPDRPVWPRASLDEMMAVFGGALPEEGLDAETVVTDLAAKADPGLVAIPGGRFFGFVIGATLPAALAADWLVSTWDQNSGSSLVT